MIAMAAGTELSAPRHRLEDILDRLSSIRTTASQRLDLLAELERLFGQAVLFDNRTDTSDHQGDQHKRWWALQDRPTTCVAQAITSLLYRLHLAGKALEASSTACLAAHGYGQGQDILSALSAEMSICFTILQGLCLRHRESQSICGTNSSIELFLDILSAKYWSMQSKESEALPHAVDLLICMTMVSKSACTNFEVTGGEGVVRSIIEKCMNRSSPTKRTTASIAQQAVTMEAVQHSAVAMKCVELLLLLASERTEEACDKTLDMVAEHRSNAKTMRRPASPTKRLPSNALASGQRTGSASYDVNVQRRSTSGQSSERRALSSSPVKRPEVDKISDVQSRSDRQPLREASRLGGTSTDAGGNRAPMHSFPPNRLSSPSKRTAAATSALFDRNARTLPHTRGVISDTERAERGSPLDRMPLAPHRSSRLNAQLENSYSSPSSSSAAMKTLRISGPELNTESDSPSPRRPSSRDKGPTPQRSPARRLPALSDSTPPTTSTLSSPLKAMMGPSPAVRRAHARSMSPDKKHAAL